MSSGRANASAIQRRTTQVQQSPARGQIPQQQQQQPQYNQRNQQPPQQIVHPKLSVSDAIALITIRLGKVETFINTLPPLDQLEMYSNGTTSSVEDSNNDNMRIVDEAVFKSIVSRLDRLEDNDNKSLKQVDDLKKELNKQITTQINNIRNELNTQLITQIDDTVTTAPISDPILEPKHFVDISTIDELKTQVKDLQLLLLNLQNYTMTTNKKLCDIIFCDDIHKNNIHDENEIHNNLSLHLSQLLSGSIADDNLIDELDSSRLDDDMIPTIQQTIDELVDGSVNNSTDNNLSINL